MNTSIMYLMLRIREWRKLVKQDPSYMADLLAAERELAKERRAAGFTMRYVS